MSEQKTVITRYVAEVTPEAPPAFDEIGRIQRQRARRRTAAVSLSLVAAVVAAATFITGQLGGSGAPLEAGGPVPSANLSDGPDEVGPRTGAVPDGSASCVEGYGPATLKGRDFAFDGTVVDIERGGSGLGVPVTFRVTEWFTGGHRRTVTVGLSSPSQPEWNTAPSGQEGEYTSEFGPSYEVGTRMLVSGEPRWGGKPLRNPLAWGCGFTRYYDKATAALWRRVFSSS